MQIRYYLIVTCCFIISCGDAFHNVTLEGFSSHRENFQELKELGLILDDDFDADFKKGFVEDLKKCGNYKNISLLNSTVSLKSNDPNELKAEYEKTIAVDGKARMQNGIFVVDLTFKNLNSTMEKSTSFRFKDKKEFRWYTNYGIPSVNEFGFSNGSELAPIRRVKRKPIFIRNANYLYRIRYALYNRVTNKVVVNGQEETASTISNFSRKPSLKKGQVQKAIFTSLKNRIISKVCAKKSEAEHIYYAQDKGAASTSINEGVDLAKQGRWKLAANKWENALLKDKKNAIAHHNLGIYYEFMGQPEKALAHYKYEKYGKPAKAIIKPRSPTFLKTYQIPDFNQPMLAQISFISAGNWVYIAANSQSLKLRKKYSIYRILMNRSEVDQEVVGAHIREIGMIKIIRKEGDYYQGRIQQSLVDYPILPGDYLIN